MSGTCIVCLGDLGDGSSEFAGLSPNSAKSPLRSGDVDKVTTAFVPEGAKDSTNENELIAHLKPCGHNLHNECLKPWVERANSCPICRAKFYAVELSNKVGGGILPDSLAHMTHADLQLRSCLLDLHRPRPISSCGLGPLHVFGRGG